MSSKIKHDFRMAERALEITETINFVNDGMRKFSEAAEVLGYYQGKRVRGRSSDPSCLRQEGERNRPLP